METRVRRRRPASRPRSRPPAQAPTAIESLILVARPYASPTTALLVLALLCQTFYLLHATGRSNQPCPSCPPPTACPAAPIFPQASAFDWLYQLPRLCRPLSQNKLEDSHPWALFGVPRNLSETWKTPGAPNDTESKACLQTVRKSQRRLRALWHPDRAGLKIAEDEKASPENGPPTAKSIPGLRPMFNLSPRHLLIAATLIDEVAVTAKFHCLRLDQRSRFLDVLAENRDLDIDDVSVDPEPPEVPDQGMDLTDEAYLSLWLTAERLGEPFEAMTHWFRQLRRTVWARVGPSSHADDNDDLPPEERRQRRQAHLAYLMDDELLYFQHKAPWEKRTRTRTPFE